MKLSRNQPAIWIAAFLIFVTLFSAGVWRFAYGAALDQLARRGQADVALAADGLVGHLERYRELAVLLSDHPTLRPVIEQGNPTEEAARLLLDVADKTGSLDILVIDVTGTEILNARETSSEVHKGRPYFERAMDGALGSYHLFSDRYEKRAFYFAAPVFSDAGPPIGSILVSANVEAVEAAWRGDRPSLFFGDDLGVIFLSNRSELIFRSRRTEGTFQSREAEYPPTLLSSFIEIQSDVVGGHEIWQVDGGPYLPSKALHIELPVPVIGMRGEVLIDVAPANQIALLQAAVAAAICMAFGAMLFLATERRRTLAIANAKLETRVIDRTADLQRLNHDLRAEIAIRRDAESQLKQAQADLVQAGKLSALGQMSAGISHELNQPLMAIRSFAENAQVFLSNDKPEVAEENLGRISELARRMGRIIKNLRAFARQETAPLVDVDVIAVIDLVVEMSEPKARASEVELVWQPPEQQIWVKAGDVRLQQVILNLVSNAIDALEGQPKRKVVIDIQTENRIAVSVRDTGPGIEQPEKIFDPFYSTKSVGAAEGMGLGLSISYGLVQSFGGDIRGKNHDDGGAIFTVELDPIEKVNAA